MRSTKIVIVDVMYDGCIVHSNETIGVNFVLGNMYSYATYLYTYIYRIHLQH